MVKIVPAVLAETTEQYVHDLELAATLSDRVQIDLADGMFAGNQTVSLAQAYWPDDVKADLHLMYDDPFEHIPTIISQKPSLVIIHREALRLTRDKVLNMVKELSSSGIKTGMAILRPTTVDSIRDYLDVLDHVMVFTGELGHYGGEFDMSSLGKISEIKATHPDLEIGVDGGVTDGNAREIVTAGGDVLNSGSYLQKADDPQAAYAKLKAEAEKGL